MKKVIDFLTEIRVNNNRDWFEAHKGEYKQAEAEFNRFAEGLIERIGEFDPAVRGLTVKDCTYRIYRDVRFSPDKSPYKTHMGCYVCPGGKKSEFAGYYFHVEPQADGFLGGNFLTAGIYMPATDVIKSIREEIVDNGKNIEKAVKKAVGFELNGENKLKRLPLGYVAGSPWDEWLKHKDFCLEKKVDNDWLLQDGLAIIAAAEYKKTYDLTQILNRAVKFAQEERIN